MQTRHAELQTEYAVYAYTHVTAAKASDMFVSHEAGMVTVGQPYEQFVAERSPIRKPSQAQTVDSRWRTHIAPRFAEVPVNRFCCLRWGDWSSRAVTWRGVHIYIPYIY
jgi:hypothetical protein